MQLGMHFLCLPGTSQRKPERFTPDSSKAFTNLQVPNLTLRSRRGHVPPVVTDAAVELMHSPQSIADVGIGVQDCPVMGSRWISRLERAPGRVLLPSTASASCPILSRPPSPSPLAAVPQLPGATVLPTVSGFTCAESPWAIWVFRKGDSRYLNS